MGKIKQGILGGFSGKVGAVTGSSWKGLDIMKSRPLSVANPRTAGQVSQRNKMSHISSYGSELLSTICQPCWNRFAVQQSGFNAFCKKNIHLMEDGFPSIPADFCIADGKMGKTAFEYNIPTNNVLELTWESDAGDGFKLSSDKAYVVVLKNEGPGTVPLAFPAAGLREDESITLDIDELATSAEPHVYLAFLREDGTVVSGTSYYKAER
jgi:hypothetical protein